MLSIEQLASHAVRLLSLPSVVHSVTAKLLQLKIAATLARHGRLHLGDLNTNLFSIKIKIYISQKAYGICMFELK